MKLNGAERMQPLCDEVRKLAGICCTIKMGEGKVAGKAGEGLFESSRVSAGRGANCHDSWIHASKAVSVLWAGCGGLRESECGNRDRRAWQAA